MMNVRRSLTLMLGALLLVSPTAFAQSLRETLKDIDTAPHWIIDDLPKALSEARANGKPLLVVLRCIPCPPGRTLDTQVMQPQKDLEQLERNFVCVRIVQTNGLDLKTFQYDYDMSWSSMFLNADGTIYGRYGTRVTSGPGSDSHLSLAAFRKAAERALELHKNYPANRQQLAGKTGPAPQYRVPEEIPGLEDKPSVAATRQNCIHCHMIREHILRDKWLEGRLTLADVRVFPMPENIGLTTDLDDGLLVKSVQDGSPAAQAGLSAGDRLIQLNGQPLISLADIQWALHTAPEETRLPVTVQRGGQTLDKTIALGGDWKQSDIAWRASSWYGLRQGVKFDPLPEADKQRRGIPADGLALVIKGMYGQGGPKLQQAGLRMGDIIVAVDGQAKAMTESEFLIDLRLNRGPQDSVKFTVLRGDARRDFTVPMW
jgi:hypothetical protein